MSAEWYEIISLAARYLFALLGVLIVLRAFHWILSDHFSEKKQRRSLPDLGLIGELVILRGNELLPSGSAVPVPWEGILGSVRSCDICLPSPGIRRKHFSFSFEEGRGLLIHPFSGVEVLLNAVPVTVRSRPESAVMVHGSFLQVGDLLLRLRLFAGLDPRAGFPEDGSLFSPCDPPDAGIAPGPGPASLPQAQPSYPDPSAPAEMSGEPYAFSSAAPPADMASFPDPQPQQPPPEPQADHPAAVRRRRAGRWEDEWSD